MNLILQQLSLIFLILIPTLMKHLLESLLLKYLQKKQQPEHDHHLHHYHLMNRLKRIEGQVRPNTEGFEVVREKISKRRLFPYN